jgi:large subunit ribosomal protein L15
MNVKKRKKISRQRGCTTHGWGARQRHKGKGCLGGRGMAGSGKRGDQKKQFALNLGEGRYFGKQGLTSKSNAKNRNKSINLLAVREKFPGDKIDLKTFKILGTGEGFKAEIQAKAASKSAIEKMKKAGGSIILPEKKVARKPVVKKEKSEKKEVIKKGKTKTNKEISKKEKKDGS